MSFRTIIDVEESEKGFGLETFGVILLSHEELCQCDTTVKDKYS